MSTTRKATITVKIEYTTSEDHSIEITRLLPVTTYPGDLVSAHPAELARALENAADAVLQDYAAEEEQA